MRKILFLLALTFSTISFTSCKSKYPNLQKGLYAEFITNKGTFMVQFYHEEAPMTVANFIALAEGKQEMADSIYKGKPFYDGLIFHRVIKDFMIQGGDPKGNGSGNPGYRFPDEFVDSLKHDKKGILSMANSGPATNGSQFFITLKPTPWLDGKHTIFGKIVEGQDVIDAIGATTTAERDKPVQDIVIQKVTIINKGVKAPSFSEEMKKNEIALKKKKEEMNALISKTQQEFKAYKETAKVLESGVQVHWLQKGKGKKPKDGESLLIDYEGYLGNGQLFATSILTVAQKYDMVNPQALAQNGYRPLIETYGPTGRTVPGFKDGLTQLQEGDQAIFFIPSHLAYGAQGINKIIPPNTDIIFKVNLLEIKEE